MKDFNVLILLIIALLGTSSPSNAQKIDAIKDSAYVQKNSKVTNLRINNIDSLVTLINTLGSKFNEFEISISLTSKGDSVNKVTKQIENENTWLSNEKMKIEELLAKEKERSNRLENNNSFYQSQLNALN